MKPCQPTAADGSVSYSTADGMVDIAFQMMGTTMDTVWGTEHMAPLVAIGRQAAGSCTYLEVGAHVGWLVLLAARMGCKVFAWEGSISCANRIQDNLRLNNMSKSANVFGKFVGRKKGMRIEDDMPADTRVTLLKMDIDGPDSSAMSGMQRLFDAQRVQYVNLEYSKKQAKKDPRYLHAMEKRGFNIYLLDCYGTNNRTDEASIRRATGGRAACLNRDAVDPQFSRSARHYGPHDITVDVPMMPPQRRFLHCLVSNTLPASSGCTRLLGDQRLHPQYFDAFTRAIGEGEVDLILKLSTMRAAATDAAANSAAARPLPQPSLLQPTDPPQEYEQLALLLESITLSAARVGKFVGHLKDRTWAGKSHIGTRPQQYQEYYSIVRQIRPKMICEIGMNAGHSTAIFLSAAGRDARLVMFDLGTFSYSSSAAKFLQALFPGQLTFHFGDSKVTFPAWRAKTGERRPCDLFSVDGAHSYAGAKADFLAAVDATRSGGVLVFDDMVSGSPTRRAFDEVRASGAFASVRCTENVPFKISRLDRYDETNVREQTMSWCFAWVA